MKKGIITEIKFKDKVARIKMSNASDETKALAIRMLKMMFDEGMDEISIFWNTIEKTIMFENEEFSIDILSLKDENHS